MIRFVFRWLFRFLLLAIVLIVAAVLLKDTIAKAVLENRARAATGLEVRIGRVEAGLGSPTLTIENLRIFNTPEFGGGLMMDVPEFHLDYDRESLASGRVRLKLVRLNLRDLQIVRNSAGLTNLTPVMASAREAAPWTARPGGRDLTFDGIDTLNLSVGTVRFIDLGQTNRSRMLTLNVENELYENLRSEDDAILVLFKLAVRRGFQAWVPVPPPSVNKPPSRAPAGSQGAGGAEKSATDFPKR